MDNFSQHPQVSITILTFLGYLCISQINHRHFTNHLPILNCWTRSKSLEHFNLQNIDIRPSSMPMNVFSYNLYTSVLLKYEHFEHSYIWLHMYLYVYIYICVCVMKQLFKFSKFLKHDSKWDEPLSSSPNHHHGSYTFSSKPSIHFQLSGHTNKTTGNKS